MSKFLVRDLAPELLERLKKHAREARETATLWQERLAGRVLSDSADLIREDRDR